MRDADTGDDAGCADGTWALADFDGVGAGFCKVFDALWACYIACNEGDVFKVASDEADSFSDARGVAVCGGDGEDVGAFIDKVMGVMKDMVFV